MVSLLNIVGLPQVTTMAKELDDLFSFIFWSSFVSFLIIVILMTFFVIRYRRRKKGEDHETPYIVGHAPLENAVAIILFVWVMVIFSWGWVKYKKIVRPPSDTLEVNVIGRQWLWEFWYLNGRKLTGELVVPKGKKIKLLMSSADVIHSFFVPAFRLKQDVVPGTYTTLWFEATQAGEFQVFCAEYCGTAHSNMMAKVKVLEPDEFKKWEESWTAVSKEGVRVKKTGVSLIEEGKMLFNSKGCNACHTVTGQKLVGPSVKGIFGAERELSDGKKVKVDENYLRESLMDPQVKLVKGFPPVMPTFRGVLDDEEVNALIAYIKSLKD